MRDDLAGAHSRAPLRTSRGYLFVALAAMLWGTLGFFYAALHDQFHLPSLTIAFLRISITALCLIIFALISRQSTLRISRHDLPFFLFFGFLGVAAFNFLYVQSVVTTNVTIAVVLLYTAPTFVAVIANIFWREPIGARKIFAIGIAFVGCALVARVYDLSQFQLNAVGIFFGIGAGFTYALYTIFSKFALEQHASLTALIYALTFGAIFLAPFQSLEILSSLGQQPGAWVYMLGLVLGPSIGALALFNGGLKHIPASNASLVAMLEPVTATGLAYFVLGERLDIAQLIGGFMVIGAAAGLYCAENA